MGLEYACAFVCVCVSILPSVFIVPVPYVLSVLLNATYSLCCDTGTNTTHTRFRREEIRAAMFYFLGAEFN